MNSKLSFEGNSIISIKAKKISYRGGAVNSEEKSSVSHLAETQR